MNKKWQLVVAGAIVASAFVAPVAEASTYTVQKGDTLTKIAKTHNTSIQNIKQWNSLKNDVIFVNQRLLVEKANNLVASNPVSAVAVEVGPVITKPVVKPAQVLPSTTPKKSSHTIVKGDTLTKIAQQHQTTVLKIKEVNQLSSDVIRLGQVLILPTTSTGQPAPTVDQVEVFTPTEVLSMDAMIQKQLTSETTLTTNPDAKTQARYTKAIALAKTLIGTPYAYGGNTPLGFDCSGFISYIFREAGFDITRNSSLNYFLEDTTHVQNPVPGDFVFFKNTYISTISHMGIYLGNNEFIHAGSKGIEITNLDTKYWADRFVSFKRYTAN